MNLQVTAAHYPGRCEKCFIVNAPYWFSALWSICSPLLDPKTKKQVGLDRVLSPVVAPMLTRPSHVQIVIYGSDYKKALCDYIGSSQVPVEFGGTSDVALGASDQEKQLFAYATEVTPEMVPGSAEAMPHWQAHARDVDIKQSPPPPPTTPKVEETAFSYNFERWFINEWLACARNEEEEEVVMIEVANISFSPDLNKRISLHEPTQTSLFITNHSSGRAATRHPRRATIRR